LLEKTEYSYSLNRKNARLNHMVFDMMLRLIQKGMTDKQQVFRLVQKEYSFLSKIRFHHVWIHIKTEAGRKDNYENYMFTKLEGTLWVREAFLKA